MAFEYVCKHYGVPACIGRRVTIDGNGGVIAEDRGHYIGVNFDSDKPGVIKSCHPTWEAEYGGMGKVRNITDAPEPAAVAVDAGALAELREAVAAVDAGTGSMYGVALSARRLLAGGE